MRIIFQRAQEEAKNNGGKGDAAWTVKSLMDEKMGLLNGRFTRAEDFLLSIDPKHAERITITWTPSAPELKDPRKRVLTGNLRTGEYDLEHVDP